MMVLALEYRDIQANDGIIEKKDARMLIVAQFRRSCHGSVSRAELKIRGPPK